MDRQHRLRREITLGDFFFDENGQTGVVGALAVLDPEPQPAPDDTREGEELLLAALRQPARVDE